MIQDSLTSEAPHLCTKDYFDGSGIPEIRQQPFAVPLTINPSLLSGYGGAEHQNFQLNASQTPLCVPENGLHQLSSHAPSALIFDAWMGCADGDIPASVPSPSSLSLENVVSAQTC